MLELPVLQCKRCGHAWHPHRPRLPKVCPRCKSPYWNRDRTRKVVVGHIWVKVKVVNPLSGVSVEEEALVDTSATYTVVPWRTYEKLDLKLVGEKDVETAKGLTRMDESFAVVEVEGKRGLTPLLVSKDLKDLLIGVLTLEALGLTVDPTTGKLKETRILLL